MKLFSIRGEPPIDTFFLVVHFIGACTYIVRPCLCRGIVQELLKTQNFLILVAEPFLYRKKSINKNPSDQLRFHYFQQ